MKLSFLDRLYTTPGAVACVYLDTSRDIEDPDKAVALRWRHLRDDLAAQGADNATLSALDAAVGTDRDLPGRHGQALFAAGGEVVLAEELPMPPTRDSASFSDIADAVPLAVQYAPDIPYVAVAVSRESRTESAGQAGLEPGDTDVAVEIQAGRWPMSRVAQASRAHRRVPAKDWQHGAVRVAAELEEFAQHGGAEIIVLRADPGDVWARGTLVNRLTDRLRDRLVTVEGRPTAVEEPDRALLEEEVGQVLSERLNLRDRMHADTFLAQRARHPAASEGMAAAVAALQRGQAQALLLNHPADRATARLWVGREPEQIAMSAEELQSFGAAAAGDHPADSVLLRAAVASGAELIVESRERLPLADGVGVLLRYALGNTAP